MTESNRLIDLVQRLRNHDYLNDYFFGEWGFDAADAIEAQAKRIEELEVTAQFVEEYTKEAGRLDARIAVLEAALKPFADKATVYPDLPDNWLAHVTMKHLRAARAALEKKDD